MKVVEDGWRSGSAQAVKEAGSQGQNRLCLMSSNGRSEATSAVMLQADRPSPHCMQMARNFSFFSIYVVLWREGAVHVGTQHPSLGMACKAAPILAEFNQTHKTRVALKEGHLYRRRKRARENIVWI